MNLPKNITQIGEINHSCKIYVEDYVVSYIKQLNGHALDKELAVGVYGTHREEDGVTYLFFYGACRLNFLQRQARHLSQAVLQEAEKARKKYFTQYDFLGYRLLNGDLVEGFHVYEQGVCRYVEGYAKFYEKNEAMLQFMVDERQEESPSEVFDQEKYEVVKRRQEERRQKADARTFRVSGLPRLRGVRREGRSAPRAGEGVPDTRLRQMKTTAAAVFIVLCGAGLAAAGGGEDLQGWRQAAQDLAAGISKKQLEDSVEAPTGEVQVGTIVAEDKLAEALKKENEAVAAAGSAVSAPEESTASASEQPAASAPEESAAEPITPAPEQPATPVPQEPVPSTPQEPATPAPEQPAASAPQEPAVPAPEQPTASAAEPDPAPVPASYTIQRGDTLIGICMKRYGSDKRVAEICTLNNISNPDNIKIGQKILLP